MKEVTLDLHQLGITATQAEYSVYEDRKAIGRHLVHSLKAYVAGEKQAPYVFESPETWWQHIKQRFFPKWALRKWPVKMMRKEASVKTVYPYLRTRLPLKDIGPTVLILVNDKPIGSFLPDTHGIAVSEWRETAITKRFEDRFTQDYEKCRLCGRSWFEFPK